MNLTDFEHKMNFPSEDISLYRVIRTFPLKEWVGYLSIERNKIRQDIYIFSLHFLDDSTDRVCVDYSIPVSEYKIYGSLKKVMKQLEKSAKKFCAIKGIKPYIIEEQDKREENNIKFMRYVNWKLNSLKF